VVLTPKALTDKLIWFNTENLAVKLAVPAVLTKVMFMMYLLTPINGTSVKLRARVPTFTRPTNVYLL
jgi:hypothetical protein